MIIFKKGSLMLFVKGNLYLIWYNRYEKLILHNYYR